MTTYAKRDNAFERGEHQWRVGPDTLVWVRPDGESLTLLWRDVSGVRLAFAPTRFKPDRHLFELRTRQGRRLTIDNIHFRGIGQFESRSAAFSAFVQAALERIASQAPQASASLGAAAGAYGLQLAAMIAGLAALTLALVLLPTPLGPLLLVKLAIIAVMIPLGLRWAVRARPRPVPLDPEAMGRMLPG